MDGSRALQVGSATNGGGTGDLYAGAGSPFSVDKRTGESGTAGSGLAYCLAKRALDIVGGLTLATVFSPVFVVVTVAMLRDDGPIFFGHKRIGKDGKTFKVYKFRTMVPNAQQVLENLLESNPEMRAEWEQDHKLRDDPRITRVGQFLRKTSLDELPQLWNVFKGEMSLVGPRPVVEAELPKYGRALRHYCATKPGITGLWQVSGRNDTDYRRRVALDRYYSERASILLDVNILLRTVWVVVGRRGAY
ncbi:MAG: sugar transferase [Nevskiales bacterium]|nr:sugar transferase [Nevskiales bacterium]